MTQLFVPGRLCLLGEHSDWAGGWRTEAPEIVPGACLVTGTDQGLRARAEADDALVLESVLPDGTRHGPERVAMGAPSLRAASRAGGFFSYAAGVAAALRERFGVGGVRLSIETDLPIGKGLSSSAALCVLVARAFSRVHGLGFGPREEMEWAYTGERLTGSECGRMDQVCAFGRRPVLMRFDGGGMELEPVTPGGVFPLLVVDLRRAKDTRRILRDLNACFPRAPGGLASRVRDALGARNAALVASARAAVEAGDVAALGALMTEAQARFDADVAPACPELRAPRLHEVLAHPVVRELALGGKGVGSQGDGCAQLVAADPERRARLAARLESALGVACLPLTVEPSPAPGAADG